MSSIPFECRICHKYYDTRDHKPLCLECGHTFCEECVRRRASNDFKLCEACVKPEVKSVDDLPVVHFLVPGEKIIASLSNPAPAVDKCVEHGCAVDQFCAECGVTVCRKCVKSSHVAHHVDFIDDVLDMDPEATAFIKELKNKMEAKIISLKKSVAVYSKMSDTIDDIQAYKNGLHQWKDYLCSQKSLVEQQMEAWNIAKEKSIEERQELFKELCSQWGDHPSSHLIKEFSSSIEKIKIFIGYAPLLEESMRKTGEASTLDDTSHTEQLFPNEEDWRVHTEDELMCAVASVRAGRTPRRLDVVTSPATPMVQLPEALAILGPACNGLSMSVRQLDAFWAPPDAADAGRLQTFVVNLGRKVSKFYGSPEEAVMFQHIRPKNLNLGVRLASLDDVYLGSVLSQKPRSVSCIRSLPAAAGDSLLGLRWYPLRWHFPDVQPGDVDWMVTLMKGVLSLDYWTLPRTIYLPRCYLSEEDLGRLLTLFIKRHVITYCEHASLSASAKSTLEAMGENAIKWTIPMDSV